MRPGGRFRGNGAPDFVEHEIAASHHGFIGETQNAIAAPSQFAIARGVVQFLLDAVMHRPVELNDQAMFDAEKIDDIAADRNLATEFQAMQSAAAQGAPENGFRCRHVAAKATGECGLSGADASGHGAGWDGRAIPASMFEAARSLTRPRFAGTPSPVSREREGADHNPFSAAFSVALGRMAADVLAKSGA